MERLSIWLSAVGGADSRARHCRYEQVSAEWYAPMRLQRRSSSALYRGIQTKRALVHHSTTLMCHCEERSDVAP